MRRVHLQGRDNILKRLLVHAGGFNLALIMRTLLGIGKPRRSQRASASIFACFGLLIRYAWHSLPTGFRFNIAEPRGCKKDCVNVLLEICSLRRMAALMGVQLAEAQKELLVRGFSRVVLLLDGDEAGQAATVRIASALREACTLDELYPEPGCQPDQLSRDQIRQILTIQEGRPQSETN